MYKKRAMLTMLESVESTKLSTDILKIINISSSADKRSHDRVGVWISDRIH